MKITITLKEFRESGGDLQKIDFSKTFIYMGANMNFHLYHMCRISKIIYLGLNDAQSNIYECHVTESLRMKPIILTGKRIKTEVEVHLDSKYI